MMKIRVSSYPSLWFLPRFRIFPGSHQGASREKILKEWKNGRIWKVGFSDFPVFPWKTLNETFRLSNNQQQSKHTLELARRASRLPNLQSSFFFFARMSCSEQSTFHGQTSDCVWSFRIAFSKRRGEKNLFAFSRKVVTDNIRYNACFCWSWTVC